MIWNKEDVFFCMPLENAKKKKNSYAYRDAVSSKVYKDVISCKANQFWKPSHLSAHF